MPLLTYINHYHNLRCLVYNCYGRRRRRHICRDRGGARRLSLAAGLALANNLSSGRAGPRPRLLRAAVCRTFDIAETMFLVPYRQRVRTFLR